MLLFLDYYYDSTTDGGHTTGGRALMGGSRRRQRLQAGPADNTQRQFLKVILNEKSYLLHLLYK